MFIIGMSKRAATYNGGSQAPPAEEESYKCRKVRTRIYPLVFYCSHGIGCVSINLYS